MVKWETRVDKFDETTFFYHFFIEFETSSGQNFIKTYSSRVYGGGFQEIVFENPTFFVIFRVLKTLKIVTKMR